MNNFHLMQINKQLQKFLVVAWQLIIPAMLIPAHSLSASIIDTNPSNSFYLQSLNTSQTCQQTPSDERGLEEYINGISNSNKSIVGLMIVAVFLDLAMLSLAVGYRIFNDKSGWKARALMGFWVGLGINFCLTVIAGLISLVANNYLKRAYDCFSIRALQLYRSQNMHRYQPQLAANIIVMIGLIGRILLAVSWPCLSEKQQKGQIDQSSQNINSDRPSDIVYYNASNAQKQSKYQEPESKHDSGQVKKTEMNLYNSYSGAQSIEKSSYDKPSLKSSVAAHGRKSLKHQL